MRSTQYVALLRGINVGGNNLIKMADLKACLDAAGFANVATYIQSGNVLFEAAETDITLLTQKMGKALTQAFNYQAPIAIRSYADLKHIVHTAPSGFGSEPEAYRYDVIFLIPPLTPEETMSHVTLKEGVDAAAPGREVVYFSRLTARATQSKLNKVIALPIYKNMTIRNWNTTTKLLALMEARAA